MINILLRLVGERALHKAVSHQGNNPLDVKFGIALLRDRRVPVKAKLLAFGISVGLLAALLALEVPLQAVVTFLAPILLPLDFVVDGIEMVALPALFTALLIARTAPRAVVEQLRMERSAGADGRVLDVQATDVTTPASKYATAAPTPLLAGSRRS